jgi:hypothetical protein
LRGHLVGYEEMSHIEGEDIDRENFVFVGDRIIVRMYHSKLTKISKKTDVDSELWKLYKADTMGRGSIYI